MDEIVVCGTNLTKGKTMLTRFRFTVFVLLLVLTACATGSALTQNRQKWASQKISHYSYEVSIGCFCAWRDLMPLKAEVKDGQVVSFTDKSGQPIPANFAEDFNKVSTIDGLFNVLDSVQGKAQEVRVEYDNTYGYPKSIHIDYAKDATDDEMEYTVENFEVLK
jgi:hypothetical protein